MSTMAASPAKRKRAAHRVVDDSESDIDPTEVAASTAHRKKPRFQPTDDNSDDETTNPALSTAASIAESHTRTAPFAESHTPLTEASSVRSKSKPRPKKYPCTYLNCDKAFDRPVRLEAHLNSHTGTRPHACQEDGCGKDFFKAEHLNRHMREKHSEQNFVCQFPVYDDFKGELAPCGKTFESSNKLKRHVAMHEDKDETTCDWEGCGKVFRKQETLQRHIKKDHLGEAGWLCKRIGPDGSACGQAFPTPGQLRGHETKDHQAPKYICEVCTVAMLPQPELEYPMPNDLDPEFLPTLADLEPVDRPLDTDMLGDLSLEDEVVPALLQYPGGVVGFATYHDLQRHLKFAHPPLCTVCSKKCKSSKDLTAHMDIAHPPPGVPAKEAPEPEKRFLCPHEGCDRSKPGNGFAKKGNMDVHVKSVHAKERSFVCGEHDLSGNKRVEGWNGKGCGLAMKTKQSLIGHIRTQHIGLPAAVSARTGLQDEDRIRPFMPKGPKAKEEDDAMDVDSVPRKKKGRKVPLPVSMLTGVGYDETRPFACLINASDGCKMRFTNSYELHTHMELTHGWNVEDIDDALEREDDAMTGADMDGTADAAFRHQLEAQLRGDGDRFDSQLQGMSA